MVVNNLRHHRYRCRLSGLFGQCHLLVRSFRVDPEEKKNNIYIHFVVRYVANVFVELLWKVC